MTASLRNLKILQILGRHIIFKNDSSVQLGGYEITCERLIMISIQLVEVLISGLHIVDMMGL